MSLLLIHESKIIFLGAQSVLMQKLFMSKTTRMNLENHIDTLFWLLDSGKTRQHLRHVPLEHLQIL